MLVHICCSVDSHFFLEKLQQEYPDEPLTGYFYDPNIHPYAEYQLRLLDVQRSCNTLGIPLLEGDYDLDEWYRRTKGREDEPEKGERCAICFDQRFERSALKALELGETKITSTLMVSPLKSQEQLKASAKPFEEAHGLEFIALDFRKHGGTQLQSQVSKAQQLYRQDYCGCLYGLSNQRNAQDRLMDEMFSPIDGRVLPASIEERLALYKERIALEEKQQRYKILKTRFSNYRLLSLRVNVAKQPQLAHALFHSTLSRKRVQTRVEFTHNGVAYCQHEGVKIITLEHFNALSSRNYSSVKALIFNPPTVEEEYALRYNITQRYANIDTILIMQRIPDAKIEILLTTKQYEDTKEQLITL